MKKTIAKLNIVWLGLVLLLVVITIAYATGYYFEDIIPITPDNITNWQSETGCTATTHHACVDEYPGDDDETSFIECDANAEVYDYFNTNSSFNSSVNITNVTVYTRVCADTTSGAEYAVCVNIDGTGYCDTTVSPGIACPTYKTVLWYLEDSPATSNEWTVDEVNAMLIGVMGGNDCNPDVHCTQIYSTIGYNYTPYVPPNVPPKWDYNYTNDTYPTEEDYVLHVVNWTDDNALFGYIFSWNGSSACTEWANDSLVEFTGVLNQSNTTKQIPIGCEGETIGWYVWANDSDNTANWTGGEANAFQYNVTPTPPDTERPKWSNNFTNDSEPHVGDKILHHVNWTDNVDLSGFIFSTNYLAGCTLWVNFSFTEMTGIVNQSNFTGSPGINCPSDTVSWYIWANDSSDNANMSGSQTNPHTYVMEDDVTKPKSYHAQEDDSTPDPNQDVEMSVWWKDTESTLGSCILEWNATGTFENVSYTPSLGGANKWCNVTEATPDAGNIDIYWRQWVNDTAPSGANMNISDYRILDVNAENIAFTVSVIGQVNTESSPTGVMGDKINFTATTYPEIVDPCLTASPETCQTRDPGAGKGVPLFEMDNTGNVKLNMSLGLNGTVPTDTRFNASWNNDNPENFVYDINSSLPWNYHQNFAPYDSPEQIWIIWELLAAPTEGDYEVWFFINGTR